jgi:hypothetical protein
MQLAATTTIVRHIRGLGAALVLALGCSSEPLSETAQNSAAAESRQGCSDNNDEACPEGQFCDRDTCRAPYIAGNLGNECVIGSGRPPCTNGLLCVEDLCRSCVADEECVGDQVCRAFEDGKGRFCGPEESTEPPSTPPSATDSAPSQQQ